MVQGYIIQLPFRLIVPLCLGNPLKWKIFWIIFSIPGNIKGFQLIMVWIKTELKLVSKCALPIACGFANKDFTIWAKENLRWVRFLRALWVRLKWSRDSFLIELLGTRPLDATILVWKSSILIRNSLRNFYLFKKKNMIYTIRKHFLLVPYREYHIIY